LDWTFSFGPRSNKKNIGLSWIFGRFRLGRFWIYENQARPFKLKQTHFFLFLHPRPVLIRHNGRTCDSVISGCGRVQISCPTLLKSMQQETNTSSYEAHLLLHIVSMTFFFINISWFIFIKWFFVHYLYILFFLKEWEFQMKNKRIRFIK